MAIVQLEFNLRGHGGRKPIGSRFFDLIGLKPSDNFPTVPGEDEWQAARIVLFSISVDECKRAKEPYEEFERRIAKGLKRVANWLAARDPKAFAKWAKERRKADIFVDGWMNSDQFDLTLPPEFLLACGRLGLSIQILTND